MTINVWSDSMQHIELLGKPALFSDSRVDRSTVPDGWYVYDLRGSDYDPDLISTLEARVIVNYAGSILTPEPVIFPDGQDYLDVKGQTDFLDEEITLIDFCRQHEMPIPSRYQIRPASFDEAGLFYACPFTDRNDCCMSHHSNPARGLVIREAVPIFVVLSKKDRRCNNGNIPQRGHPPGRYLLC